MVNKCSREQLFLCSSFIRYQVEVVSYIYCQNSYAVRLSFEFSRNAQSCQSSLSQFIQMGRNGNFVFKGFNNSKKTLPPVGLDLMLQIITGLGVQYQTDELSLHLLVSLRILDPYIVMLY